MLGILSRGRERLNHGERLAFPACLPGASHTDHTLSLRCTHVDGLSHLQHKQGLGSSVNSVECVCVCGVRTSSDPY